jgi:hypothetical protein
VSFGEGFKELRNRQKGRISFAVVVILSGFLFALAAVRFPAISVQDEQFYSDHLVKASRLELGQSGDFFEQETLEEFCWRGAQEDHPTVPNNFDEECIAADRNAAFGTNYTWPLPVYFITTGLVARGISSFGAVFNYEVSVITIGRLLGALWFALGVLLTLGVASELKLNTRVIFPLSIGLAGLQSFMHEQSIVNPDASSFAMGALLFLMTVRFQRAKSSWVTFLAAALLVALVTRHHLTIIASCAVYLIMKHLWDQPSRQVTNMGHRHVVKGASVLVAAAFFSSVGWTLFTEYLGRFFYGKPDTDPTKAINEIREIWKASGFHWYRMLSVDNVSAFLIPSGDKFPPAHRYGGPFQTSAWLMATLLLAAVVGAALFEHNDRDLRLIAIAHICAALTMPIFFVVYWNVTGTMDVVVPRFAMSNFPLILIVSGAMYEKRRLSRSIVWIVSLGSFGVALLTNFVTFV